MSDLSKKISRILNEKRANRSVDIIEESPKCSGSTPTRKEPNKIRNVIEGYQKCSDLVQDYVVFDLETTGLDPSKCEIIEFGAIRFLNGKEVSRFQEYVRIDGLIPEGITKLTGITNQMLSQGESIKVVLEKFKEYIGDCVLIAHNAKFDMKFLQTFYASELGYTLSNMTIDTLPLAREYMKRIENHKLATIKAYFHIDLKSHNAIDDCYVTSVLYQYCVKKAKQGETKREKTTGSSNNSLEAELSDFEKKLFETTTNILSINGFDCSKLSISKNYKYTDIRYEAYTMLRFKTSGRLKYWLLDMDIKTFSFNYSTELKYAEGSKNEENQTRLFIDGSELLLNFENYIIDQYRECHKNYEEYISYEKKGRPMHWEFKTVLTTDDNGKTVVRVEKHEY